MVDEVNDLVPRTDYVASAAQEEFDFPWPILHADHLVVLVDGVVVDTYTVAGVGEDEGGTITMDDPMVGGEEVVLYRATALERLSDIPQANGMRSATVNNELDKLYLILQETRLKVSRALRAPTVDPDPTDLSIPSVADRIGKFLAFDGDGNPTVSSGTGTDAGLREDLAQSSEVADGASLVGFYPPGSLIGRSIRDILIGRHYVDALDFVPGEERAAILDFTSATDVTTYIQNAINYASTSRKQMVVFPAGLFNYTKLYLYFDAVLNPGFDPADEIAGHVILEGAGNLTPVSWNNGERSGTVLDGIGTASGVYADADEAPQLRTIKLRRMTVTANGTTATDYVFKGDGLSQMCRFEDVFFVQKSAAASGVIMEDAFLWSADNCWIYNDTEVGTALGLIVRNVDTAAGAIDTQNVTVRGWGGATLGAATTITGITQANPAVVSYTGTDPVDGDVIFIEDVVGMTEVNDKYFSVGNVNAGANTLELRGVTSVPLTAYTSGGTFKVASAYGKGAEFGTFPFGSGANINTITLHNFNVHGNVIGIDIGQGVDALRAYCHVEASLLAGAWVRGNATNVNLEGYFLNPDAGFGDIIIGDSEASGAGGRWRGAHLSNIQGSEVGIGCGVRVDHWTSSQNFTMTAHRFSPDTTGFGKGLSLAAGVSASMVRIGNGRIDSTFAVPTEGLDGVERFDAAGFTYFGRMVEIEQVSVASANDIAYSTGGNIYRITGATQINTLSAPTQGAADIIAIFASNPLVKHATAGTGKQFNCPGGVDYQAAAGDVVRLIYDQTSEVWQLGVLKGALSPRRYDSGDQTITAAGSLTLAHGLGVKPKMVQLFLKCLTTEANYSAGDEVCVSVGSTGSSRGASLVIDATNINVRFGSAASTFALLDKTTGTVNTGLTNTNWAMIVRAYA